MKKRHFIAGLLLSSLCTALPLWARHEEALAPSLPYLPPAIECWYEPRSFAPAFGDPIDYCRGHFGFRPGDLDCYHFTDQVCWVFSPAAEEWVKTYTALPPVVFECQDAPKPPQCPELRPGGRRRFR